MRVLVIGGSGFLGSRTLQALAKLPGAQVTVGYRGREPSAPVTASPRERGSSTAPSGGLQGVVSSTRFDLDDPSTFSEMKKHDFVVNTSDTLAALPTLAIDYALYNGVRFVEAGAHSGTMDALMRRTRGPAADTNGWTGTLLLGMGLFPGLSNLLAAQLLQWAGPPEKLDLVVRLNPLAGSGPRLVELMVRATQEDAVYYEGGTRVSAPPIRSGVRLFTGKKTVPTVGIGLPEAHMLSASLGIPWVATYVTTIPALPGWMAAPLLRWIPHGPDAEKVFVPLMRRYLRTIRTVLFKGKPEFVEINVVTERGDQLALRTDDGIAAAAHALAASVAAMAALDPPPGAYLPDELLGLGDVMNRVLALAEGDFQLTLHSKLGGLRLGSGT
jgi:hypothetical protein